jgi:hypothetical protein
MFPVRYGLPTECICVFRVVLTVKSDINSLGSVADTSSVSCEVRTVSIYAYKYRQSCPCAQPIKHAMKTYLLVRRLGVTGRHRDEKNLETTRARTPNPW